MTNESKILTVSYGTFSCTLEGFDDPFHTMKAIAEYFRDLTADDRYFGAEPPQPDAAMLHRIADREVSRLINSKSRDAGLVLRASDFMPAEGRDPGHSVSDRAPVEEPAPPAVEPAVQDAMPSGVVAKLARIRDSVSKPLEETRPEDVLSAFHEETVDAAPVADSPAVEAQADTRTADAGDAASRIGALLQDPEADASPEASDANIFADLAAPETAPAAAAEVALAAAPEFVEDRVLAAFAEADAAAEAPFIEVEDLLPEMPAPEMTADASGIFPETGVEAYEDEPQPALDTLAAAVEAEIETVADVQAEVEAEFEAEAELVAALSDPEDLLAEYAGAVTDATPEATAELSEDFAEEMAAEMADVLPEDFADPEVEAPLPTNRSAASKTRRVNSRVVRIHPDEDGIRKEGNATRLATAGEAEELARLMRTADDVMADEENRRRLDSLAHLKAAVAATEADRAAGEVMRSPGSASADAYRDDLAKVVQPDPEPSALDVKPRRKTVSVRPQEPRPGTIRPNMVSPPPLVLVSEQRVDRIIPTHEGPLSPSYAPAAKAPAPLPPGPSQPGIDSKPLVAVRTGRLTGAIGFGAAAASPILPQERVLLNRAAPESNSDDEDGFDEHLSDSVEAGLADFAESVGVKSMAEMLEAAAAYATCVERREQFTRPQLMRRLMASAGGKAVSREEGLRSFGTLLRTGRIEKVSRGHYVLAENSPYLAEARRIR